MWWTCSIPAGDILTLVSAISSRYRLDIAFPGRNNLELFLQHCLIARCEVVHSTKDGRGKPINPSNRLCDLPEIEDTATFA
jgi:hypothetical protein